MNWDQVEGKWKEFSGQVKQKWNKLTDDDIGRISGKKDELMGSLQKRYGYSKEQAGREIDEFSNSLRDDRANMANAPSNRNMQDDSV